LKKIVLDSVRYCVYKRKGVFFSGVSDPGSLIPDPKFEKIYSLKKSDIFVDKKLQFMTSKQQEKPSVIKKEHQHFKT
jgi:hypothetical protein